MICSKNLVSILAALLTGLAVCPKHATAAPPDKRYIAVANSDADYVGLRNDVIRAGGRVIREIPAIQMLVATAPDTFKAVMASSTHAKAVAADHIVHLVPPQLQQEFLNSAQGPRRSVMNLGPGPKPPVTPDPAFSFPGLMWDWYRIGTPAAWKFTTGDPAVKVGVADTGLDFTHAELQGRVSAVVDLTVTENPALCTTYFGASDADWAKTYGGPPTTDWNGHGTWIGGNIAADLDGQGINGIAPNVKLVALKISQWCGYAYDSTILDAFVYAADNGIDIVSISFGGYLDPSDHDQFQIYLQYIATVAYALRKGTVIVAAAGNEHLQLGPGGLVLSHGILTTPGDTLTDYFGWLETPGGVPGVVAVAATGNVVNALSASCPPESGTSVTCKPLSDAHKPSGVGQMDQLAYYSNYGPRIDIAAPGGARKFNLPVWDRGGTPGYPVTIADGTNAWETFGITSDWALEIPCYTFTGGGFPADQCYSTIQGTSMATPHVSAGLALIASANRFQRHNPWWLLFSLRQATRNAHNTTPGLSATDHTAGDLTGALCGTGYCHLGGPPIPDNQAYGAGILDLSKLH